jgi:mannose-6-phosphate isomerase class I
MKIVRSQEVNKVDNSPNNHIEEYLHGDKTLNLAIATCSERYPDKDFVVNTVCQELVYVMSGHIILINPKESISLNAGDSVLIDKNEPFAWQGSAKILTVCTPSWYPEQHILYSLP